MQEETKQFIEEHFQKLGFSDVYSFALHQLIKLKEEAVLKSKETIAIWEDKYGMDFSSFNENFHEVEGDHFEKEDDSMDWEMEVLRIQILEKQLDELKQHLPNDDE